MTVADRAHLAADGPGRPADAAPAAASGVQADAGRPASGPWPSPSARALLALTLVPELGPRRIRRLVSMLGGPEAALDASMAQLAQVPSVGRVLAERLARGLAKARRQADEQLHRLAEAGVTILGYDDPCYPPLLAGDEHAPALLYVRGSIQALAQPAVGIVGARACSAYGIDQAARFAGVLAQGQLAIVSGGARGIDTAAHRAALRVGGVTVAVLGCGLGRCYPAENQALFDQIAQSGGAVVSELPMDCAPEARNFPARNRIIAGLSLGVLVVEAGERSGALITARLAGEMGREVMAIPGRVDVPTSLGCHELIRDGVTLVATPAHVEEAIAPLRRAHQAPAAHQTVQPVHAPTRSAIQDDALGRRDATTGTPTTGQDRPGVPAGTDGERKPNSIEERVLHELAEAMTLDELCERLSCPPERVRAAVTLLEIRRRVRREGLRLVRVGRGFP